MARQARARVKTRLVSKRARVQRKLIIDAAHIKISILAAGVRAGGHASKGAQAAVIHEAFTASCGTEQLRSMGTELSQATRSKGDGSIDIKD